MFEDEKDIEMRVDRKLKAIMRVIWASMLMVVIWIFLIIAFLTGTFSTISLISIGLLSLLLPVFTGVLLAREQIHMDLIDEERKHIAKMDNIEKRKNVTPERLTLNDDGELIEYEDYYEDESQYGAR